MGVYVVLFMCVQKMKLVIGREGDIIAGYLKVTVCRHFQKTHTYVSIERHPHRFSKNTIMSFPENPIIEYLLLEYTLHHLPLCGIFRCVSISITAKFTDKLTDSQTYKHRHLALYACVCLFITLYDFI